MFQSLKSCRKQKSTVINCHYNNTSFCKPIYLPFCYFSIWLPSYCLIFFIFTLQDSLDHILKDRSSGHKLPQTLFILESLNFLPFFWRAVLLDIAFLVDTLFLWAFWILSVAFWSPVLLLWSQLLTLLLWK